QHKGTTIENVLRRPRTTTRHRSRTHAAGCGAPLSSGGAPAGHHAARCFSACGVRPACRVLFFFGAVNGSPSAAWPSVAPAPAHHEIRAGHAGSLHAWPAHADAGLPRVPATGTRD